MFTSIIDSAKELGLTQWDWAAIIIAILSFIASVVSIYIAFKTLKSQIKTQTNTGLLLSQKAGYEYLKAYIPYVITSYMRLSIFDTIINKKYRQKQILHDYIPTFFYELSLPQEGIRPDQFVSYPIAYDLLYRISSFVSKYNELVDFIKKRIINNSFHIQVMGKNPVTNEFEITPLTFIEDAKALLKQITFFLVQTIKLIKSETEKNGEDLSDDDVLQLKKEIDLTIQDVFNAIKIDREVHSKELDACVFDVRILDWIINDSEIKKNVKSIYTRICRLSFFDMDKYLFYKSDNKLSKREQIVDDIRTLYFLGETSKAMHKINCYFIEDINNIGRYALSFKEDIQNDYFKKELRRIRKFYDYLYECINSKMPQSLDNIDFEKWNSFDFKAH